MTYSFLSLSWQKVAGIAFAASVVAASACSSSGTNALQAGFSKHRATPLVISYKYYTVDDPNGTKNEVTGINDSQEIVGSYSASNTSNVTSSYISTPASPGIYQSFSDITYPDALQKSTGSLTPSTYTWAISPGTTASPSVEAGWAFDVGGFMSRISGSVNNQGLWKLMHPDSSEGTTSNGCNVMELLGINDSHTAVGYYTPTACTTATAFEVLSGETQIDIPHLPYSNSEATGINDSNTVVGWASNASTGSSEIAWSEPSPAVSASPMPSPPGGGNVKPTGINNSGLIVGEYTVTLTKQTQGFVYSASSGYQTIAEACSTCTNTVVYGIDDSNDICGSYLDSTGKQHGFVALAAQPPRHARVSRHATQRSTQP